MKKSKVNEKTKDQTPITSIIEIKQSEPKEQPVVVQKPKAKKEKKDWAALEA